MKQLPTDEDYARGRTLLQGKASLLNLKGTIGRTLCSRPIGTIVGRIFGDRIPYYGGVVDTHNVAVSANAKAAILFRLYESAEVRFVRRYLPPGLDIVELGSSIGVIAQHILRRQQEEGRLICVEANPDLIQTLRANTDRYTNSPHIIQAALHYPDGLADTVDFVFGEHNIDGATSLRVPSCQRSVKVPATTLTKILERTTIGDYGLVCDIEGAEAGMLACESESLSRCRFAVFEFHHAEFEGRVYSVEDLIRRMTNEFRFCLMARNGPVCAFSKN